MQDRQLVTNFTFFFEKAIISPSLLKINFVSYWIWGWFTFSNTSIVSLLSFWFHSSWGDVSCNSDPCSSIGGKWLFFFLPLISFSVFSLSLVFFSLIMIYPDVVFVGILHVSWTSLICHWIFQCLSLKILSDFYYKYFFFSFISFLPFWYSSYV